ncbi:hypothetical protein Tco_1535306 [Tanacetum coccineum]
MPGVTPTDLWDEDDDISDEKFMQEMKEKKAWQASNTCTSCGYSNCMFLDKTLIIFGRLPHLGVPLITKQISLNDCKPLVEKVKAKVKDWKNKALSYAGRLQLIDSINFELNANILGLSISPTKSFLWCQGELTKGKAKVSWDTICKPKDQGGLGLKNLYIWNEVLLVKHLWNVAAKKDTLWVKWINVEKLKGRSIWDVQSDSNSSMGWKNILSLRDKVRKHIWWKLGNGKTVYAWHDKWCSVGPLSDFISTREIYDARLSNNCAVADIVQDGSWVWPNEWLDKFPRLRQV